MPAGTALTTYTGPCTVASAGYVIDKKIVNCNLRVLGKGVKITRSQVNGSIFADSGSSGGSFDISDSDVRLGNFPGTGLGDGNFTALRVHVTGGNRSINCYENCRVESSYVHDQFRDNTGTFHESGIRMGSNAIIRGNTVGCTAPDVPPDAGCSAAITGYGDFDIVQKNTIEGNLILADSGAYCAYGGSTKGKPFSAGVNNIKFVDNIWQKGSSGRCGWGGPITSFDSNAPGNEWRNNVYDDGRPVSPAN